MKKTLTIRLASVSAALVLSACGGDGDGSGHASVPPSSQHPNILFVMLDDVGIDQMTSFGYGGPVAPYLPNMDTVATEGVRFRNTWAMPECSPSRAGFFVGQMPHRTNVWQALGHDDLANAQVSPYAMTTPKLLKQANYESAMFGKFHLAGPTHNEAGNLTPYALGWDYFYGWIDGMPGSIDTTAGGIAPEGTYSCGFVPGRLAQGGADTGACYQPDGQCATVTRTAASQDSAGLQCLDSGGVFVPHAQCGNAPSSLNFLRENGYYVSPLVIIDNGNLEKVALTDARARGYRTRIETDAAIDWINSRSNDRPWMATVSYTSAHTPWQQPPGALLNAEHGGPASDAWDCTNIVQGRLIQNRMTEALDTEFGRLLVETGLATQNDDGSLNYSPAASNTVIVIIGDNGTLGTAVKEPFIPSQAKGTSYQTGVWVPLIISGPQVVQANRNVEHMVNGVDLFEFFAEIAGIDAHAAVPATLDSVGIDAYLTSPDQASLRTLNFTLGGLNIQENGARNGPCVITTDTGTTCMHVAPTKGICEDNLGVWWGKGHDDASVIPNAQGSYALCADVNQALYKANRPMANILADTTMAVRDDHFKLVRNTHLDYNPVTDGYKTEVVEELFEIDQATPAPLLDTPDRNLLPATNPDTQATYDRLKTNLDRLLASAPYCAGDGNQDGVVDATDVANYERISKEWGLSSTYDVEIDGVYDAKTNYRDGAVIQANLGKVCPPSYGIY